MMSESRRRSPYHHSAVTTTRKMVVVMVLALVGLSSVLRFYGMNPATRNASFDSSDSSSSSSTNSNGNNNSNGTNSTAPKTDTLSLVTGELPGYTGWARPARTLAGTVELTAPYPPTTVAVGEPWNVALLCTVCSNHSTGAEEMWFYLRAYGPAILAGSGRKIAPNRYRLALPPLMDAGVYTVEVVVTFSQVPPLDRFPLDRTTTISTTGNRLQHTDMHVYYEGYLVRDFPMILTVRGSSSRDHTSQERPYCDRSTLTIQPETKLDLPLARWKLIDSIRTFPHTSSPLNLQSYQEAITGIGLLLEYQFHANCRQFPIQQFIADSLPPSSSVAAAVPRNPYRQCIEVLNTDLEIILIGDSTMRIQKDVLEAWTGHMNRNTNYDDSSHKHWSHTIQIRFYELYGGILRCDRLTGPRLADFTWDASVPNRIVIFNSGLHDIHRLCGAEWRMDRMTYLSDSELQMPCTTLYAAALQHLVDAIVRIPANLRIFQTSTAAWPKYGNVGVAWDPTGGQPLPLDPGFVERFNTEIAIPVVISSARGIAIMDGYWITASRPDHREVDAKVHIGKKLSHPGIQVVRTMVQIWSMILIHQLCPSILR